MSDNEPTFKHNTRKGDAQLVLRDLDRDLRDQFKAWCAVQGRNMTEYLAQHMYDCVTGEAEKKAHRAELKILREKREMEELKNPHHNSKLKRARAKRKKSRSRR